MNAEDYRSILAANLSKSRTNADEELLVKGIKQALEYLEALSPPAEGPALSTQLWTYYTTVRVPARVKARGLWLKAVKATRTPKPAEIHRVEVKHVEVKRAERPSKFIHLTDKALKEFLESTEHGRHEYLVYLDDPGRVRVEVTTLDGKHLGYRGARILLHGVYRYVLAPSRSAVSRLYAYEEGDNSWKHSQFLRGAPVLCAGMIHVFKGLPIQFSNGSGHYQPPKEAIEEVRTWLRSRGVEPRPDQFDVSGSKSTPVDRLFEWMREQEEASKRAGRGDWEFATYEQLLATCKEFTALGPVKKNLAIRQGMAKSKPA